MLSGWRNSPQEGKANPSASALSRCPTFAWRSPSGFKKRRIARGAFVEKIIQTFPLYPFDLSTARIYAQLWANLAKKGVTIGAHDLMIASTAIALGFSVVTSDVRDYSKIKEVSVEKFVG